MFKNYLHWPTLASLAAAVGFYFLIDELIQQGVIDPYYELNLYLICINIILGVSLNVINGLTGQFSVGHAGFMAIGAYASAVTTMKFGYPFPVGVLIGALAAALAGILVGIPTLRLKGDYLAIATLGFGEIIRVVFINIEYVGGAAGFNGISQLASWGWIWGLTVATVIIIRNFSYSAQGRACIAIRENEIAAETMGINLTQFKVIAFTLGAFFAGVAGSVHAHYFYTIQPTTFSFLKSFEILIIIVLGGLGSITGAIIAAIGLTIISAYLQSYAEIRMVLYSLILIIVMLVRPQGLLGTAELTFNGIANTIKKLTGKGGGTKHDTAVG